VGPLLGHPDSCPPMGSPQHVDRLRRDFTPHCRPTAAESAIEFASSSEIPSCPECAWRCDHQLVSVSLIAASGERCRSARQNGITWASSSLERRFIDRDTRDERFPARFAQQGVELIDQMTTIVGKSRAIGLPTRSRWCSLTIVARTLPNSIWFLIHVPRGSRN